jgi:hypothetical protein
MSPQEFLKYVIAEPFRPFRIRMNSGRTFDIRHPEMIRVTKHALVVFSSVSDSLDVYDDWESVSPLLVESVSFMEAPVT